MLCNTHIVNTVGGPTIKGKSRYSPTCNLQIYPRLCPIDGGRWVGDQLEPWTSSFQRQYLGLWSRSPLTVRVHRPPLSCFYHIQWKDFLGNVWYLGNLSSVTHLPKIWHLSISSFSPELAASDGNLGPSHKATSSHFIFCLFGPFSLYLFSVPSVHAGCRKHYFLYLVGHQ